MANLQEVIKTKDASLASTLVDAQDLQDEVDSLKADREKVKVDAYTEGFKDYLKGFLPLT